MSLRWFHLLFVLIAIVGADYFGVWSVWDFTRSGDPLTLTMGVVSVLGGLGLIWYAVRLVKRLDRANIR